MIVTKPHSRNKSKVFFKILEGYVVKISKNRPFRLNYPPPNTHTYQMTIHVSPIDLYNIQLMYYTV